MGNWKLLWGPCKERERGEDQIRSWIFFSIFGWKFYNLTFLISNCISKLSRYHGKGNLINILTWLKLSGSSLDLSCQVWLETVRLFVWASLPQKFTLYMQNWKVWLTREIFLYVIGFPTAAIEFCICYSNFLLFQSFTRNHFRICGGTQLLE